jgi:hypothetical protein
MKAKKLYLSEEKLVVNKNVHIFASKALLFFAFLLLNLKVCYCNDINTKDSSEYESRHFITFDFSFNSDEIEKTYFIIGYDYQPFPKFGFNIDLSINYDLLTFANFSDMINIQNSTYFQIDKRFEIGAYYFPLVFRFGENIIGLRLKTGIGFYQFSYVGSCNTIYLKPEILLSNPNVDFIEVYINGGLNQNLNKIERLNLFYNMNIGFRFNFLSILESIKQ